MTVYNVIMLLLVVAVIITVLVAFLKPGSHEDIDDDEVEEDPFSVSSLVKGMLSYVNEHQNLNVEDLNFNRRYIEKILRDQDSIDAAIKTCAFGDRDAKRYMRELVKQKLVSEFDITTESINNTMHFDNINLITTMDKFDILLYLYKKRFGKDGMSKLIIVNNLDTPIGEGYTEKYAITREDLDRTFSQHYSLVEKMTFDDKLEVLSQRIYSSIWGLGPIDELLDMNIDGVRGGTSGIPAPVHKYVGNIFDVDCGDYPLVSFNAIWIMFKGKHVHLSCIGFGSEKEFERVAKKIYKYDNPGTLSADRGGIVNDRMDGSRVVVVRPPFAENWAFFVRKLDVGAQLTMEQLVIDTGREKVIELLKWIVTGCLNLAITGEQGCGKTTLMMSLVQFINHSYTIRTQETAFELNLKRIYLKRDALAFRETATVSGQFGINLQKKTDGSVNLMGEVADAMTAALAIQTGQTGSNQVMFTGHMVSAKMLVAYFRDCLCNENNMTEKSAESLVASVVHANVHAVKESNGHRHIQRITVIIPKFLQDYPTELDEAQKEYYYRQTDRPVFEDVDLVRYYNGEYYIVGEFPQELVDKICTKLSQDETAKFKIFCDMMREDAIKNRDVGLGFGDAQEEESQLGGAVGA